MNKHREIIEIESNMQNAALNLLNLIQELLVVRISKLPAKGWHEIDTNELLKPIEWLEYIIKELNIETALSEEWITGIKAIKNQIKEAIARSPNVSKDKQ